MAIKLTNYNKSAIVKNLVKNHKLVTLIDKYIGTGEFYWEAQFAPKEGDDAWHPSGDCTPSLHDLYLKATGQATYRPHSVSLRKTFMVGHFWHAYIQHIVVALGLADEAAIERRGVKGWGDMEMRSCPTHVGASTQFFHKPYQWATGSGDIAPCSIPGHGEYLIDIKTMGAHDYKRNDVPAWASAKYECQLNIYMDWFDLDRAILLAVCKDSPHDMKEYEYVRNQDLVEAIYKKWELVSQCVDQGIEPPADEEFDLPLTGPIA